VQPEAPARFPSGAQPNKRAGPIRSVQSAGPGRRLNFDKAVKSATNVILNVGCEKHSEAFEGSELN
jgi:hypothetical protein